MEAHPHPHVQELVKKITELSDALAHLGKGTSQQELLKIIRFPGYTTPAEFAFNVALLDAMQAQTVLLEKMGADLLVGARQVVAKGQ